MLCLLTMFNGTRFFSFGLVVARGRFLWQSDACFFWILHRKTLRCHRDSNEKKEREAPMSEVTSIDTTICMSYFVVTLVKEALIDTSVGNVCDRWNDLILGPKWDCGMSTVVQKENRRRRESPTAGQCLANLTCKVPALQCQPTSFRNSCGSPPTNHTSKTGRRMKFSFLKHPWMRQYVIVMRGRFTT